MSTSLEISALPRRPDGLRRFIDAAYPIYVNDPHWVAPLRSDLLEVLSDVNPFFEHAQIQLWVVSRGGRDVGRIAGIVDHQFLKHQDAGTACFGFFEADRDPAVSHLLFDTLMNWARERGFRRVLGPVNPSTNDPCGLLVDGFNEPPVFMMTYNPPYYESLFQAGGLEKVKDLHAFHIDLRNSPLDRLNRIRQRFARRQTDLQIRPLLRRTFTRDLAKVREIYNEAWETNWGFVPMTGPEIDFIARRLKPLLVEGLVWIAETASEPVGFLLAVPDYHEALKPLRGRLWTPRFLNCLPYLLGWRRPRYVRVMILGVKQAYRGRGVESAMLAAGLETGGRIGFRVCEASWVLEDNLRSRRVIEAFGGKVYKTYRLYHRAVPPQ